MCRRCLWSRRGFSFKAFCFLFLWKGLDGIGSVGENPRDRGDYA